ncbi:hypothetical protein [Corynebacterium bovis]|uniref:hypothetical protein n=1 Tax=Corynebacterium bovis TaxID=36808 RepID=UPI0031394983
MDTVNIRRGGLLRRGAVISAGLLSAVMAAGALSGCSSDGGNSNERGWDVTSAPSRVLWSSMAGVKVPSGRQGPAATGPVRHGYERSPQGAVLAAVNGQALLSLAPNDKTDAVSDYVLAPGRGRDQWRQARVLADVSGVVDPKAAPRFSAFKITDYSDDAAQVVVAADYSQPERWTGVYPVQLRWINDDWRVVNPTREDGVHVTPVDNIDGFTAFAASAATPTS